jgi:hypothetical protein
MLTFQDGLALVVYYCDSINLESLVGWLVGWLVDMLVG